MGKRQRKLARRAARAQRRLDQEDVTMKEAEEPDIETIVAYGAARFGATTKRHQAVPVEVSIITTITLWYNINLSLYCLDTACKNCSSRSSYFGR